MDLVRGLSILTLLPACASLSWRLRSLVRGLPSYSPHEVPGDFFGINIAAGPDDSYDEYLLDRLDDLGVRSVRIDYGYRSESRDHAGRLIPKLHARGHRVLLHLVQPPQDAWRADKRLEKSRWQEFVEEALARFEGKIAAVELGSTPNRFSWSGYTIASYVGAVAAAAPICERQGVPWYGPNVSDFSPFFNIGILARLGRHGLRPAAHTDNLFVDRAGQPENNDKKVSHCLSRAMDFDLPGKARILAAVNAKSKIDRLISTYAYWTLNTNSDIKPRYVSEEQYARYLVRYGVLTAACGHLEGVYWGQLISHAKGLIDDNSGIKPRIPTVHHQWLARGDWREYRVRPGFRAMSHMIAALADCRFVARLETNDDTFAFEFVKSEAPDEAARMLVAWTRDHLSATLAPWFHGNEDCISSVRDMYGEPAGSRDLALAMEPVFVEFTGSSVATNHRLDPNGYLGKVPVPSCARHPYRAFDNGDYRGIVRTDVLSGEIGAALSDPESLLNTNNVRVVKDSKRNLLAELSLSTADGERRFYFKAFKGRKPLSDRRRSRAFKAWSNICEILYREIDTPHPVALIENSSHPTGTVSYLIVESAVETLSLRSALECIRKKQELPIAGIDADEFLRQFGIFSRVMHRAGIYHRDYTGGNVLVGAEAVDGRLQFTLIDIARVRFYRRVGYRRCFLDLSRVRLDTEDRAKFFHAYMETHEFPWRFPKYWWRYRLVHFLYRAKYNIKKPKRLLKALIPSKLALGATEFSEQTGLIVHLAESAALFA